MRSAHASLCWCQCWLSELDCNRASAEAKTSGFWVHVATLPILCGPLTSGRNLHICNDRSKRSHKLCWCDSDAGMCQMLAATKCITWMTFVSAAATPQTMLGNCIMARVLPCLASFLMLSWPVNSGTRFWGWTPCKDSCLTVIVLKSHKKLTCLCVMPCLLPVASAAIPFAVVGLSCVLLVLWHVCLPCLESILVQTATHVV